MPADPAVVAAYLAERTEQGAAASTVRTIRAAIGAAHRDQGADDPTRPRWRPPRSAGAHPPRGGLWARPSAGAHRRGLRCHPRNGQHPAAHRVRHGIGSGRRRPGRRGRGDCQPVVPGWVAQACHHRGSFWAKFPWCHEGLLSQPRPTSRRLRHRVMLRPYHSLTALPIPCIILLHSTHDSSAQSAVRLWPRRNHRTRRGLRGGAWKGTATDFHGNPCPHPPDVDSWHLGLL